MQPDADLKDARYNGGWPHRAVNYYSWALSCLQLRKYYPAVELYTDNIGKEILVDKLKLPYTNVVEVLDDLNSYDSVFWALGKLYTYGLQNTAFLHVDGDVFIFDEFSSALASSQLIAQNIETNTPACQSEFSSNWDLLKFRPDYFKDLQLQSFTNCCNAGIFGGRNIPFIKNYVKEFFSVLEQNKHFIVNTSVQVDAGHINVVLEQVLLYLYAQHCGEKVTYLFGDMEGMPDGIGFIDAAKNNQNYVHCFGHYKTTWTSYAQVEDTLRKMYPMYYELVNKLIADAEI